MDEWFATLVIKVLSEFSTVEHHKIDALFLAILLVLLDPYETF